jgi:hypothetical protein
MTTEELHILEAKHADALKTFRKGLDERIEERRLAKIKPAAPIIPQKRYNGKYNGIKFQIIEQGTFEFFIHLWAPDESNEYPSTHKTIDAAIKAAKKKINQLLRDTPVSKRHCVCFDFDCLEKGVAAKAGS